MHIPRQHAAHLSAQPQATEQAGRAFADKLGIQGYTEVAPDGDVTDVFQAVVETYMKNLKVESCAKTCVVM